MFISSGLFEDEIENLIKHLNFEEQKGEFFVDLMTMCTAENELYSFISDHFNNVIKESKLPSKNFTYRSSIVSLYGFFESFLENLLEEFITCLNDENLTIDKIPKAISSSHLEQSIKLLSYVKRDRKKSDREKSNGEKEVIKNLHSFLQKDINYILNEKAFSLHTANFRYELIQTVFARIGVEHIASRTLCYTQVQEQLAKRKQQDPLDDAKTLQSWLESELDELTQLRNEISHGVLERVIESTDLVIERAQFIKTFGLVLADILYIFYKEVIFLGVRRDVLGKSDQVFPHHNCFGFEGKKLDSNSDIFDITVGDVIYAFNKSSKNKILQGNILSIRLNDINKQSIQFPNKKDVTIQVDFEVTNGMFNKELSIKK